MFFFASLASAAGAQTTQYTQLFTNINPTGNQSASTVGWKFYIGAMATDYSTGNVNISGDIGGISLGGSNPSSDPAGVLFASPGASANQIFAATTTFTAFNADTFTWRQGNGSTTASVYLMIQQGGNWYASTTAFQNSSAYTGGTFSSATAPDVSKSLVFSTSAANWHLVTLNPGSQLSYSLTALTQDLASSTITGVGFYLQSTTQSANMRIDTLNITGTAAAIPEPSAYTTVAGLSVLGLVAGRRRVSRRS